MKKLLTICLMTALCAGAWAQGALPAIKFDHTEHVFGKVANRGGEVSHTFAFTNVGKAPLLISSIETSCNCTKAAFDRKPVMPGEKGTIVITYNPRRQKGTFYKAIQVFSNDPAKRSIIVVQGEVVAGK